MPVDSKMHEYTTTANINDSCNDYVEGKKPDVKAILQSNSMYIKHQSRQNGC